VLGADDPGILAVPGRATRRELVPTVQVFAKESPKPPVRILTESVNLVAAAGTARLTNRFTYANLLLQRGVRLRETMKITTPSPERSMLINNILLMRWNEYAKGGLE